MGNSKRLQKRKEWLYEQNPYCPHCGIKMIFPKSGFKCFDGVPNLVTIEHINNRYDLEKRHKPQSEAEQLENLKSRKGRTILLCRACNEGSANQQTKDLAKEELWQRSGRRKKFINPFLRIYRILFCS